MTIPAVSATTLPAEPSKAYVKPTPQSTKGGKTYKPTHAELFEVQGLELPVEGAEDAFASRLVAMRVRLAFLWTGVVLINRITHRTR